MHTRFLCKSFFLWPPKNPLETKKKTHMQSITAILSEPKYAAGIAAALTIFAKWMDHRVSNTKGTLGGYIKSALFSAGLVGFWVYMVRNPDKIRESSSMSSSSSFSRQGPPAPSSSSSGGGYSSSRYSGGGGSYYN
jgi:hypothetical protein